MRCDVPGLQRLGPGRLRLWRVARPGEVWEPGRGPARWSRSATEIIYASSTAGLAVLEALAHLARADARRPHRLATLELALGGDDALMVPLASLPGGWKRNKALTRGIGEAWLASRRSTLLLVPSALVAGELNVLIDASSARWKRWRRAARELPFRFDARIR